MNDIKSQEEKLGSKQPYHSDGSELIPAEVQANRHQEDESQADMPTVSGSTIDDKGRLNNFAVEPKIYPSEYPSRHQQRRYIYWGIAAALLVVSLVLISTFVS